MSTQELEAYGALAMQSAIRTSNEIKNVMGDGEFGADDLVTLMCGVGVMGTLFFVGLVANHVRENKVRNEKFQAENDRGSNVRKENIKLRIKWYEFWKKAQAAQAEEEDSWNVTVVAEPIENSKLSIMPPQLGPGKK